MDHRKVEGEEREQLLRAKKPAGFNYGRYLEVLSAYDDGEVVAVAVGDQSAQRGEKIRFSRAARQIDKSVTWLDSPKGTEIAFQLGPLREKRARAKRAS